MQEHNPADPYFDDAIKTHSSAYPLSPESTSSSRLNDRVVRIPDVQCEADKSVRDVGRLIDENMQEYWTSFGISERGTVFEDDELTWSYTGGPYLNRVTNIKLAEASADRRIQETHDYFRQCGAAVTWLVTPLSRPIDIDQRLQAHGCVLQEQWLGMAADPSRIDLSPLETVPLYITDLDSQSDLQAWSSLVGEVYQLPAVARTTMHHFFTQGAPNAGERWRHYLAFNDETPVATATLFLGSETAGIYLVSTRPEYQRRGFARALTAHAARDAVTRGYDLIVLQATSEGQRLYQQLGFEGVHTIDAYRWEPSSFSQRVRRFLSNRLQ